MIKHFIIGAVIGIILVALDIIFFLGQNIFFFILVVGLLISLLPVVIGFVLENNKEKEIDDRFLEFIRDLIENVKSGTPISKAIVNISKRDYGALTEHVRKLANQILLGIPLQRALEIFATDTRSAVVRRSVLLVSEAQKAGGNIESILGSVADSVRQTRQLKREQKAAVYNLVVQGYIIFIVFIIIMLVLQYYILPMTENIGNIEDLDLGDNNNSMASGDLSTALLVLLLTQSFFAGLVIGKISEGSVKAGIKHSFILLAIALLVTSGANIIFG